MTTSDVVEQDQDVPAGPAIRVRVLIALMRVLAGRRGHSRLVWFGQGFRYELGVRRSVPATLLLDDDPTALGRAEARRLLLAEFTP